MDFSIRRHHCFWSLPRAISSADLTAPVVSAWLATSCLGASPWPPLGSVQKLHILLVLPRPGCSAPGGIPPGQRGRITSIYWTCALHVCPQRSTTCKCTWLKRAARGCSCPAGLSVVELRLMNICRQVLVHMDMKPKLKAACVWSAQNRLVHAE